MFFNDFFPVLILSDNLYSLAYGIPEINRKVSWRQRYRVNNGQLKIIQQMQLKEKAEKIENCRIHWKKKISLLWYFFIFNFLKFLIFYFLYSISLLFDLTRVFVTPFNGLFQFLIECLTFLLFFSMHTFLRCFFSVWLPCNDCKNK